MVGDLPNKSAEPAVAADRLSVEEIDALKRAEASNRDRGAASYESRLAERRGLDQLDAEARGYLSHLAPARSDVVLDAGAGVGRLALMIAPNVQRMVCTDFSAGALGVLESHAKAKGLTNVATVQADMCNLPRTLGPFDAAYSVEVLQHIPSHRERLAAVRGLYELLKPGGKCLVSVIRWRDDAAQERYWGAGDGKLYAYHFTPRDLGALMQEAGFRDVQLRGLIVVPKRITRRLPMRVAPLEALLTRVPFFADSGRYVVGIARR